MTAQGEKPRAGVTSSGISCKLSLCMEWAIEQTNTGYLHLYLSLRIDTKIKLGIGELADKPGSVMSSHSSRIRVTTNFKRPTQGPYGPYVGLPLVPLFGLAPGGVYLATNCYQLRGALLPHHFTLTQPLTKITARSQN